MSIDFTTLQGLTIPEGVVTQITDESGRVIWAVQSGKVVLQVEKITSDTYAGETTYTGEQFILLDIYPRDILSSKTVTVTYGGLTKTLLLSGLNSQQVFFGSFNGVSDSVATAASGELTIEGDFIAFSVGSYKTNNGSKINLEYCGCITAVTDFGSITTIIGNMFESCTGLTSISIPNGVTSISARAFYDCTGLTTISMPSGLESIMSSAFFGCSNLKSIIIPDSVTEIDRNVFEGCTALTSVTFENTSGWYVTETEGGDASTGTAVDVSNPANNATLLAKTYSSGTYYWYRS